MQNPNPAIISNSAPRKRFTRGIRSLLLLGGLGSVAAIIAVAVVGSSDPSSSRANTTIVAEAPTSPLAVTLLSADRFTQHSNATQASSALKSRETLADLVMRVGATPEEAYGAISAVLNDDMLDARRLRPGLKADAWFEGDTLTGLSLREAGDKSYLITRLQSGDWHAAALNARLTPSYTRIATTIETSIYDAARQLGAGDQQVVDFASAFAYDIDFQREIHPGDTFEIVYETLVDERGTPVKTGNVVYAELDGKALSRGFYHFTPSDDGVSDYFDTSGESATKFLMKTPINGARLSSSFGKRRHPISGYTRLHKGTDFAAPRGTPIYAAGHGTIERANRYGGYGKYIRIRHANGYKTAYAHMRGFKRGIRKGKRVRQGDVIGYVGSTGASTGPHLHYEVYIKGKPVNAMKLKLPTGRKLAGSPEIMEEFSSRKAEIDAIRYENGLEISTASLQTKTPKLP
ncbi:MAG: M23 family metallopeptidase [Hyphomonas sp.]